MDIAAVAPPDPLQSIAEPSVAQCASAPHMNPMNQMNPNPVSLAGAYLPIHRYSDYSSTTSNCRRAGIGKLGTEFGMGGMGLQTLPARGP